MNKVEGIPYCHSCDDGEYYNIERDRCEECGYGREYDEDKRRCVGVYDDTVSLDRMIANIG